MSIILAAFLAGAMVGVGTILIVSGWMLRRSKKQSGIKRVDFGRRGEILKSTWFN